MAEREARPALEEMFDFSQASVAIVSASWHPEIVENLVAGAERCARKLGVNGVVKLVVPGCFELPLGCLAMAEQGYIDAVAGLGVVVRGETVHFDLVSEAASFGIQQVQLQTKVPIGLGILAVESERQAIERSQDDDTHNAGYDAMEAALVMSNYTRDNVFELVDQQVKAQLIAEQAAGGAAKKRRRGGRSR